MSFANTNRSSWRDGAILSRPTSARRSGTSAHAEPPLWAHAWNSVITVPTKTSFSTPAAIALAPSASPGREINGWPKPLKNYCRCPTPMSLSRCRTSFRCWPSRIHAGCIDRIRPGMLPYHCEPHESFPINFKNLPDRPRGCRGSRVLRELPQTAHCPTRHSSRAGRKSHPSDGIRFGAIS
jgi:hypothetical protein